MRNIFYISILILLLTSGCAAPQKYYKNTRYTENVQGHLNNDLQYCHAIASGTKPAAAPYIPPSPTTTYGSGIVTDNHGNVYTGNYQQTTYPNENQALMGSMNNFTQTIQASNIYQAVKARCLTDLGWYEISRKEYENTGANNNKTNNIFIKFTSTPSGATVFYKEEMNLIYNELKDQKTPFVINFPHNITKINPECYKAKLGNIYSKEICFENYDTVRNVDFKF